MALIWIDQNSILRGKKLRFKAGDVVPADFLSKDRVKQFINAGKLKDDKQIKSVDVPAEQNEDLLKKIDDLTKENEKLSEANEKMFKTFNNLKEEIKSLKKENKKLNKVFENESKKESNVLD